MRQLQMFRLGFAPLNMTRHLRLAYPR